MTMLSNIHTRSCLLIAVVLATCSTLSMAQLSIQRNKHKITVGVSGGITKIVQYNTQHKQAFSTKSLSTRVDISKHIKLETGLSILSPQAKAFRFSTGSILSNSMSGHAPLTIPATVEYYPFKSTCKAHPFCGLGLQYTCNPFSPRQSTNDVATSPSNTSAGTNYINLVFTQGITYEINTKIQITQSFHFIPQSNATMLGINMGVGYCLH